MTTTSIRWIAVDGSATDISGTNVYSAAAIPVDSQGRRVVDEQPSVWCGRAVDCGLPESPRGLSHFAELVALGKGIHLSATIAHRDHRGTMYPIVTDCKEALFRLAGLTSHGASETDLTEPAQRGIHYAGDIIRVQLLERFEFVVVLLKGRSSDTTWTHEWPPHQECSKANRKACTIRHQIRRVDVADASWRDASFVASRMLDVQGVVTGVLFTSVRRHPPPLPPMPPRRVGLTALFDFDGTQFGPEYLVFAAGDLLLPTHHQENGEGWGYYEHDLTGRFGWAPSDGWLA